MLEGAAPLNGMAEYPKANVIEMVQANYFLNFSTEFVF